MTSIVSGFTSSQYDTINNQYIDDKLRRSRTSPSSPVRKSNQIMIIKIMVDPRSSAMGIDHCT